MQRKGAILPLTLVWLLSISVAGSISHYGYNFLVQRTGQSIA
ncbi:hypothetical protein [Bartonella sp. LB28NMGDW]